MTVGTTKRYTALIAGFLAMGTGWALLLKPAFGDTPLGFWVVLYVFPAVALIWLGDRLLRIGFGRS